MIRSVNLSRALALTVAIVLASMLAAIVTASVSQRPAEADHGGVSPHPGEALGFGVVCDPVHEFDTKDPILLKGQVGDTHNHAFTGGGDNEFSGADYNVNNNTSPSDLRNTTTTCRHNADKALYWTPKASGTGAAVQTQVNYYQPNPQDNNSSIGVIPANLEMIAGSVPMNGDTTPSSKVDFGCQGSPATSSVPINCGTERIKVEINFPDCVERNASGTLIQTSTNGRSHVYYSDAQGDCVGNDQPIPQLKQHWIYQANSPSEISWSVPHYDMHADFMNGWNQATLESIIDECIIGNTVGGCMRISN